MANNYGDIRLNLQRNWNRRAIRNNQFVEGTVGHHNGLADVRLERFPDQPHAFCWVDLNNQQDVQANLDDGYVFVKRSDGWVSSRWQWRSDDLLWFKGQVLMAMSQRNWEELQQLRAGYELKLADPMSKEQMEQITEQFDGKVEVVIEDPDDRAKKSKR